MIDSSKVQSHSRKRGLLAVVIVALSATAAVNAQEKPGSQVPHWPSQRQFVVLLEARSKLDPR